MVMVNMYRRVSLVGAWALLTTCILSLNVLVAVPVANAQSSQQQQAPHHAHSLARQWIELLLDSIRNDQARVVVHARNLFHVSAAMWDAWAVWADDDDGGGNGTVIAAPTPWLFRENVSFAAINSGKDRAAARQATISYAAYGLLRSRFADSPGFDVMSLRYDELMSNLGYETDDDDTDGDTTSKSDPRAVGVRIADAYIQSGLNDGSNEANDYSNRWYRPVNSALIPDQPGTQRIWEPDRWQPLSLRSFIDQSGVRRPFGYPGFLGPEWGGVVPFSLGEDQRTDVKDRYGNAWSVYLDPGPPPLLRTGAGGEKEEDYRDNDRTVTDAVADEERLKFLRGFEMVLHWSDHLDSADGVLVDASPNSIGNATLPSEEDDDFASWFYDARKGGDVGPGYSRNPVTGETYPPQYVPRGDYGRVLAEFWADGPDSETPPGHWFAILNDVMDHPAFERRIGGGNDGPELDPLEYEIKAYFALGGAMHDAAIAAWSVKGWYDYVRPISAIRWMAENGQRSEPNLPNYHPLGLELIPGQVEIVTSESTQPGGRHELIGESNVNEIAVKCWRGPDYIKDPKSDAAGCGWILALDWWPYQRPTFVTPNFAGYVSGHSTYSRAAAEILTLLTGSPYFPGGLGEYVARAGEFLVFEDGPSIDVRLQWASYHDASDQCSLSRIWGGIHPPADDIPGRIMGSIIGPQAFDLARSHFEGRTDPRPQAKLQYERPEVDTRCPEDITGDGKVNGHDFAIINGRYTAGDPDVSYSDMVAVYIAWQQGKECSKVVPTRCPEDINGDGMVSEDDFNIMNGRYLAGDPGVSYSDMIAVYLKWQRGGDCP